MATASASPAADLLLRAGALDEVPGGLFPLRVNLAVRKLRHPGQLVLAHLRVLKPVVEVSMGVGLERGEA